jgi:hypothetical protein
MISDLSLTSQNQFQTQHSVVAITIDTADRLAEPPLLLLKSLAINGALLVLSPSFTHQPKVLPLPLQLSRHGQNRVLKQACKR